MKVTVLGSGAGALAVAADMSRHGRRTVMAEFDGERARLEPVRAAGNITTTDTAAASDGARDADTHAASAYPVDVADSVAEALAGAELVAVVAPPDARERWARAVAPHTTPDHTVLFLGEGGGAIVARRVIEPPTVVAETNTLPHRARAAGPATVDAEPRRGGVLVASLPASPPRRSMHWCRAPWPGWAVTSATSAPGPRLWPPWASAGWTSPGWSGSPAPACSRSRSRSQPSAHVAAGTILTNEPGCLRSHRPAKPRSGRPVRPTSPALPALLEHPPRTGPRSVSNDLHSRAPRATLSGMANDCPVLMVLLWCQFVNDDVRLHDGAPAAQGRESCLEWDCP